jgi:hypothetical protein
MILILKDINETLKEINKKAWFFFFLILSSTI